MHRGCVEPLKSHYEIEFCKVMRNHKNEDACLLIEDIDKFLEMAMMGESWRRSRDE